MHIGIAGNIGVGKTTLCKMLGKHFTWKPSFEAVDNNPYLNDFYLDMQRWSFNLQVFFLIVDLDKLKKLLTLKKQLYRIEQFMKTHTSSLQIYTLWA